VNAIATIQTLDRALQNRVPVAGTGLSVVILSEAELAVIDAVLGRKPHARTIALQTALTERDAALRRAARCFPAVSTLQLATELASALARYRATAWRQHRLQSQCPREIEGTLKGELWRALKARDAPLSASRLRQILSIANECPIGIGSRK
jgi:hypothetical protein